MKKSFSRWKFFLLGSVAVFFLQGVLALLFFRFIGDHLAMQGNLSTAEAIVVLGGDSCDFHRTQKAIQLWRTAKTQKVVLSCNSYTLQAQLEAAQRWGLTEAERTIILDCESTWDEAGKTALLVKQYGWRSLIVVTDRYHTLRARNTFRKRLPGVKVQASEAFNSTYDQDRYWRKEGSLDAVFHETIKSIYYWYAYGIWPW